MKFGAVSSTTARNVILHIMNRRMATLLGMREYEQKKRNERLPPQRTSTCAFIFYRYYRLVNVVQVGTSVSCILCRTIMDGRYYEPHLIRCQVLASCVQGGITMHSRCMDAADDKSVQPMKVFLVAALHVPLLPERIDCLLRPAPRIWA